MEYGFHNAHPLNVCKIRSLDLCLTCSQSVVRKSQIFFAMLYQRRVEFVDLDVQLWSSLGGENIVLWRISGIIATCEPCHGQAFAACHMKHLLSHIFWVALLVDEDGGPPICTYLDELFGSWRDSSATVRDCCYNDGSR